ncbi:MAG TPA: hypothetical protein VMW52_01855 [Phycisphaerae bacterium]|nr:hypothetical protein [Phycisphaerae bacterium]
MPLSEQDRQFVETVARDKGFEAAHAVSDQHERTCSARGAVDRIEASLATLRRAVCGDVEKPEKSLLVRMRDQELRLDELIAARRSALRTWGGRAWKATIAAGLIVLGRLLK